MDKKKITILHSKTVFIYALMYTIYDVGMIHRSEQVKLAELDITGNSQKSWTTNLFRRNDEI